MLGYSSCTFEGNLARCPDLKQTKGGISVCAAVIAVDQTRGKEEHTTWVKIMIYGERAEYICKNAKTGDTLTVHNARYFVDEAEDGDDTKRIHNFVSKPGDHVRLESK